MTIFVVFRVQDPGKIRPAIQREFSSDHYDLGNNEWLISSTDTTEKVAARLGIPKGENGSAIVFAMSGYYGRAPTSIWEWIKSKAERPT